MIAAALLLQAAAPVTVGQVGPFVVETHVRRLEGPMYPLPQGHEFKSTVLRWKSASGLASYELNDDGGEVAVTFEVGMAPRNCLGRSGPLRLTMQPAAGFGRDDLLGIGCRPVLDTKQIKLLKAEVQAAQPYFATAYSVFRQATLQQHGPLLQRCRQTTMGYHGLICVAFWDEGRSVNDQQKNKRTQ